ncbi:MAG: hypothetical protein RIF41_18795 [Polyangiaceae bacterium]
MKDDDPTAFFWSLAEGMLDEPGITKGTMMGFPCLRLRGDFFASCEHRTGALIAKLDKSRVEELVESGEGLPFAPAGRRFKEWVMVEDRDEPLWTKLLVEARDQAEKRAS